VGLLGRAVKALAGYLARNWCTETKAEQLSKIGGDCSKGEKFGFLLVKQALRAVGA
jgi:hypothetical protein